MSTEVKAVVWKKRNIVNFFCFNNNVSNLYNNDVIIYNIKKVVRTILFVNEFSYYNNGQILKFVHKKYWKKNICL